MLQLSGLAWDADAVQRRGCWYTCQFLSFCVFALPLLITAAVASFAANIFVRYETTLLLLEDRENKSSGSGEDRHSNAKVVLPVTEQQYNYACYSDYERAVKQQLMA